MTNIASTFQVPSSYGLRVRVFEEKDDLLSYSINAEGVSRIAGFVKYTTFGPCLGYPGDLQNFAQSIFNTWSLFTFKVYFYKKLCN